MAVDTPRKEVTAMYDKWRRCRDVMAGEDAVKHRGEDYLPKLTKQQPDEYRAYKKRAVFYGGTARTRNALVGLVLSKQPDVSFPEALDDQLEDVTLDGTPLEDFIAATLSEVLEVGRFGVLIDMPAEESATARPYWVRFKAEDILNWSSVRRNGDQVLTLVVLHECEESIDAETFDVKSTEQWRVLRLIDPLGAAPFYTSEVFQKKAGPNGVETLVSQGVVVPTRRGQKLPFIPFSFVGATGIGTDICEPPLSDMASVNLSHYRSSADLEHGRHFCGLPMLWVVGMPEDTKEITIGSTMALVLNGPNASAGYAEFSGQGLGPLENALKEKMEMMAVLGARLVDSNAGSNETAESVRARQAAAYATLMSIANSVSRAVTNCLRWHAWWMGIDNPESATPPIACELNTVYFMPRMDAGDLRSLLLAVQAGTMSFETFYWNLQLCGMTRPSIDAKAEMDTISSEESWRAANDAVLLAGAGAKPDPTTNPDAPQTTPQPKAA